MKLLSKIINSLIADYYKIDIVRTLIVVIRFVFFHHITKKTSYFIDPNKKIDEHIFVVKKMHRKKL